MSLHTNECAVCEGVRNPSDKRETSSSGENLKCRGDGYRGTHATRVAGEGQQIADGVVLVRRDMALLVDHVRQPAQVFVDVMRARTIPIHSAFIISGVAQHSQNTFCEMFLDLGVARDGLGNLRGRVVIPIVLSTVTNEHTPNGFKLSDEIFALHRTVSSASFRTPGISPLVRSQYRSRRCTCRSSNDSPCVQ